MRHFDEMLGDRDDPENVVFDYYLYFLRGNYQSYRKTELLDFLAALYRILHVFFRP